MATTAPSQLTKIELTKIERLLKAGNMRQGKALAEKFLKQHPDPITTNIVHAHIAYYEGNMAVARQHLKRVLDIRPGFPPALRLMGEIEYKARTSEDELEEREAFDRSTRPTQESEVQEWKTPKGGVLIYGGHRLEFIQGFAFNRVLYDGKVVSKNMSGTHFFHIEEYGRLNDYEINAKPKILGGIKWRIKRNGEVVHSDFLLS